MFFQVHAMMSGHLFLTLQLSVSCLQLVGGAGQCLEHIDVVDFFFLFSVYVSSYLGPQFIRQSSTFCNCSTKLSFQLRYMQCTWFRNCSW